MREARQPGSQLREESFHDDRADVMVEFPVLDLTDLDACHGVRQARTPPSTDRGSCSARA